MSSTVRLRIFLYYYFCCCRAVAIATRPLLHFQGRSRIPLASFFFFFAAAAIAVVVVVVAAGGVVLAIFNSLVFPSQWASPA